MLTSEFKNEILELNQVSETTEVLIYSYVNNKRLQYCCRFIFNQVLGCKVSFTTNLEDFESSNLPKINYSSLTTKTGLKIHSYGLLSENHIALVKPASTVENKQLYFFHYGEARRDSALRFDIFSAVFYFISRYEEWQDFIRDKHSRFEANESVLFRDGYFLKPVVDQWIMELKNILEITFPSLIFPTKKVATISTIDVDNLYAYKHKGVLRTGGAILKNCLKLELNILIQRLAVISRLKKDPFDVYKELTEFCKAQQIPLIYFFLFHTGTKFDRTVNPKSRAFKNLFQQLQKSTAMIGIHPSYEAAFNSKLLNKQIEHFKQRTQQPVVFSRQHYLRFDIKITPGYLLDNGIEIDFTMGYASTPGFRAGTSFPFYYYDFYKEKETKLLFVPFCAMDGAFTVYESKSPDEAYDVLKSLYAEIKKVNGLFVTVFHERSFYDHLYPGYGSLYKKLYTSLKADEATKN